MANELTGDFDVVAEFSIPAANRVLAAMHRSERFPHSCAIRVDDNPPPGSRPVRPTIVGSADAFGDATVNHNEIGTPSDLLGQFSAADPLNLALDPVVNPDVAVATVGPIVPSHLQGRAQLQFAPPTIEVADGSGSNITVRVQVMARYFPDPGTSPLAEFGRGEFRLTTGVNQVASQTANVVEINLKADNLIINFSPAFSSQPLSAQDLAGLNLLIRNALKTSFLPSNTTLPSNVKHMQFKTLLGAQNAIALLLNMAGARGNPASLNNVFLRLGDDFAFAAGRDFILAAFPVVRDHRVQHLPSAPYDISNTVQTLDLQEGQLLFTMTGDVHRTSWPRRDFNFIVKQALTLNLVATTAGGPLNTAQLAPLGDVSFEITGLPWGLGWIANRFTRSARDSIRTQRDAAINAAQPNVMSMLNIDAKLGTFLQSLLKPPRQDAGAPPPQDVKTVLAYTSVKINSSGIVLHGSLAVPDWPLAHVEFQQILATDGGAGVGAISGLRPPEYDYTALRSWIPGGAIQRYDWRMQEKAQGFHTDVNKFVLIHTPPAVSSGVATTGAVSGFIPICLTVRGTRIASSGPAVAQPVTASVCGYTTVPILEGVVSALDGALLMVALTQPGPGGRVEIAGHAAARPDGAGGGAPNRIVHFPDEKTAGNLEFLMQALRESGRRDAATAVLAVLTPDQLAKARYTEGVIYAEEQGGAWGRAFGVKTTRRPLTLIVGPKGDVVWQHEGELDSEKLAGALGKNLAPGGSVRLRMLRLSLRIGRPAPNFLFELAPGRGLTLRKLVGRPTMLVFWKSLSKPSLETVRDLQETTRKAGGPGSVVLAINDGEAPELAEKVGAENGLSAILVPDPKRKISLAYGVNIWPTTVFIDAFGLVREIRYGRFAGEHVEYPSPEKAAAAR